MVKSNLPNPTAEYTTIIKPSKGWQSVDWREVYRYRDLLYFLVVRGIKAKYAQSVLGVGWAVITPIFTVLVYTIVFGRIARIGSDGIPYALFSFSGLVPWTYFSTTLSESSGSLSSNADMISKVYFPRIVLPLSVAFTRLLDFLIGMCVLAGFMIYFQYVPTIWILIIPVLMVMLLLSSLGLGMFLSAIAIQYRDVRHAIGFMMQFLMYAAPVIYPLSKVPEQYLFWYSLNPMVGIIEGFRAALLGTGPMPWQLILTSAIMGCTLFLLGTFYFNKMERKFADVA